MIMRTKCFPESSCKHCKTAVLVKKNQAAFLALPPWEFEGKVLQLARKKFKHYGRFCEKSIFLNLTDCFILKFSQCHLVNLGAEIHL